MEGKVFQVLVEINSSEFFTVYGAADEHEATLAASGLGVFPDHIGVEKSGRTYSSSYQVQDLTDDSGGPIVGEEEDPIDEEVQDLIEEEEYLSGEDEEDEEECPEGESYCDGCGCCHE